MSIPSQILLEEIRQQGFSPKPYLNFWGEVCIGYGHRLMESPDILEEYDEDLCKAIKLYHGYGLFEVRVEDSPITTYEQSSCRQTECVYESENSNSTNDPHVYCIDYQKKLEEQVFASDFSLTEEKAFALLQEDLLSYHEMLIERSSGFRRLANLCGQSYYLPESQMGQYAQHLQNKQHEQQEQGVQKIIEAKEEYFPYPSSCKANQRKQKLHKGFSSSLQGGKINKNTHSTSKNVGKQKNKELRNNLLFRHNSSENKALIRLDVIIGLSHLLGIYDVLKLRSVFASLLLDDYHGAAGYLLSHSKAKELKDVMVFMSRRLRYGDLLGRGDCVNML